MIGQLKHEYKLLRNRKLVVEKGADGWRWNIVARNGKIIDASTESFTQRGDCVKNMRLTFDALSSAIAVLTVTKP